MRGCKIQSVLDLNRVDKYEVVNESGYIFCDMVLINKDITTLQVVMQSSSDWRISVPLSQKDLDDDRIKIYELLTAHPMSAMVEPPTAERSYRSDIYANKDACRRDNHELVTSYVTVNGVRQNFIYCKQCKKEAV